MEERSLILRFSIARLGDGFEVMGVTLVHDKGKILVAGQTITDQHAAEVRPQCIENHLLAPALFDTVYFTRPAYVTVVLDYDTGRVVWMSEGRQTATIDKFFEAMPTEVREGIEAVAVDTWEPYINAVKRL